MYVCVKETDRQKDNEVGRKIKREREREREERERERERERVYVYERKWA